MKLVTFNCNFNKGGIGMVQDLLDADHDVICIQRFCRDDLPKLRFGGREHHFYTSFPDDIGNEHYGLLTAWAGWLGGSAKGIDLQDRVTWADRHQGNTMVRLETETHSIINSLIGYPEQGAPGEIETWRRQAQQCLVEASDGRTILVGDFHYNDGDPIWQGMNLGLLENKAGVLNAFRTTHGHLISLTKIFAGPKVLVHGVHHALRPHHHPSWHLRGMHWPICMEYIP